MDDVRLALLGDKAAQERMTERGELLPCAHCKGRAVLVEGTLRASGRYSAVCGKCFNATTWCVSKEDAIGRWNTRAPILSAEEMEMLERMEVLKDES